MNRPAKEAGTKNSLIVSDPDIHMGKPMVRGTRITPEVILDKLAAGLTVEQLIEQHLRLTRAAVQTVKAILVYWHFD